MAKYKFFFGVGYVGANHETEYEIDDEELEGKTESEITSIVEEHFIEWMWNYIDSYWERID